MYSVDESVKALALSPARRIYARAAFGSRAGSTWENDRDYTDTDHLISAAIDIGSSSAGFTIGNTYCAKLTLRLQGNITVNDTDRIIMRVGFLNPDGTKAERIGLGWFYVDTHRTVNGITTVTAYDKMLRAAKNYNPKSLTFPCYISDIINDICDKMNASLAVGFEIPYDALIDEVPIKTTDDEGNKIYYTMREVLGYIGSIIGGNWFFDAGGKLAFTRYKLLGDVFAAENSMELSISDVPYKVAGVSWNVNGVSYSRVEDVDALGVIEFKNPFKTTKEPVLHYLEERLVGLSYHNGEIKRQGCGWFELGDIVNAYKADGTCVPMLISAINYTIADGGFVEKIYSSALTDSQSNYTSGDVTGQTVPPSVSEQAPVISPTLGTLSTYTYLTDNSIEYNGTTYTVEHNDAGLITKITDDKGGDFAPEVNGDITDVAFHNAVLTAVAMLCGLPRPLVDTLTPMVQYRYNAESLTQSGTTISLLNQASGGDVPTVFTGATKSDNSVYIAGTEASHGEMAWSTENSKYTIYLVARCESVNALRIVDTQGNAGSSPTGAVIYGQGGGIWRAAAYNGGTAVNSAIPQTQLAVLTVRMTAAQFDFYANGVHVGTTAQISSLLPGVHYFDYGHRWGADNPGGCYYYDIAFAVAAHSDADIIKNSKYLMAKYGIT